MGNGVYRLASGRRVFLTGFHLDGTYAGALEGSPETISQYILESLRDRARADVLRGKPLVLQEPHVRPLPPFRVRAEFESSQGVKESAPDLHSELAVWFFASRIDVSIDELLMPVLQKLDWDAHAQDFDILP